MYPNQDQMQRQYQLETCRAELKQYEDYCRVRQQYGYPYEPPQFNQFGQVTNMPPNLRRPQFPTVPFPTNQYYPPNAQQTSYQAPNNANSFSLCYTLSDDRNSPARQFFEQFQHHPMLPKNLAPKRIVFVYERPDVPSIALPQNAVHHVYHYGPQVRRQGQGHVDAGVGDASVVRYNVETQTEWEELEQPKAADNCATLHNAIMPPVTKAPTATSNLSQPATPEFNYAVMKVAKWLQMTQKICYGIETSEEPRQKYNQQKNKPAQLCLPQPPPSYRHHKSNLHGSQPGGKFKKRVVAAVPPSSTIGKHHSTVELEVDTKRASNVVEDGDDNKNGDEVERDSEKLVFETAANDQRLVGEGSVKPVAEKCSESNEVKADINTDKSHGHNEGQKDSANETEPKKSKDAEDVVDLAE